MGFQAALDLPKEQDQVRMRGAGASERMANDYRNMSASVEAHPMRLLRPALSRDIYPIESLQRCTNNSVVLLAGMVTARQRRETARGIVFLLLEDETGMLNVVVRPELWEAQWELYRGEPLPVVRGVLKAQALRMNLVAQEAWPLTDALPDAVKSSAARWAQRAVQSFDALDTHN